MDRARPIILLVDDDPTNVSLLNLLLREHYAVRAANCGLKALEVAHLVRPDLILLDVMMPDIDGFEVCRRLKNHPDTRNTPVIFLTAKHAEDDEVLGFKLGAADFIHKPINPPILEMRVKSQLQIKLLRDYLQSRSDQERAQKAQLMQIFSLHVSPEVAATLWQQRAQLLTNSGLPPQRLTATVLFSDIRNFTTISEQLDPHVLFVWLNEYLDVMSQVVQAQHGVVSKYIGDAVMAVFGLPRPDLPPQDPTRCARRAADCALAMREQLAILNQQFAARGLPAIAIRIGIASGSLMVGEVGSQQRREYTVIGDTVNIAARLEATRAVSEDDPEQCRILLNDYAISLLADGYRAETVGELTLKGKQRTVEVWRLLGRA